MKKIISVVSFFLIALCLLSCQSQKDINDFCSVKGKTLNVTLQGNPTTGYTWTYKNSDEFSLKSAKTEYKADTNKKGFAGSGGVYNFVFKGQKGESERKVTLTFEYARSWEDTFIDMKQVTVTVLPDGTIKE